VGSLFIDKRLVLALFMWLFFFIGNASFKGAPLVLLLPFFFAVLIYIKNKKYKKLELLAVFLVSLVFFIKGILLDVSYNPYYPSWVVSLFFGYFITAIISDEFDSSPSIMLKRLAQVFLWLLLFIGIGMILSEADETGRTSFIFGPNMLYRLVVFLSIPVVAYYLLEDRKLLAAGVISLSFYLVLLSGSKGGVASLLVLLLSSWHFYQRRIKLVYLISILVLIGLFFSFFSFDLTQNRITDFSRVAIDTQNHEDSYIRLRPWLYLLFNTDRLDIIGIDHSTFMVLFGSHGFKYPHNILLELIIFYGVFGLFVAFYMMVKVSIISKNLVISRVAPRHAFYYSILGAGLGTFLSGDLGDNGVFIGAIFAFHVSITSKKIIMMKKEKD